MDGVADPVLEAGDSGGWTDRQPEVMQDLPGLRSRFDPNFHVGFADVRRVVEVKMVFDLEKHGAASYTVK